MNRVRRRMFLLAKYDEKVYWRFVHLGRGPKAMWAIRLYTLRSTRGKDV